MSTQKAVEVAPEAVPTNGEVKLEPAVQMITTVDGKLVPSRRPEKAIPPEEAFKQLVGPLLQEQLAGKRAELEKLRRQLDVFVQQKRAVEQKLALLEIEGDSFGNARIYRANLEETTRQEGIFQKKVKDFSESLAEAEKAEASSEAAMESIRLAEEGMKHFLLLVRETWWEKRNGALCYMGHVPKYTFAATGADATKPYFADVGPFTIRIQVSNLEVHVDPLVKEAHCSGRPDSGTRNYHPHLWTHDNYKICWGTYDGLYKEAKKDRSPFGVMTIMDRLFRACGTHRMYTDMFKYWDHRARKSNCTCPGCVDGTRIPKEGDCPCFACQEGRGFKGKFEIPAGAVWAVRDGADPAKVLEEPKPEPKAEPVVAPKATKRKVSKKTEPKAEAAAG